MAKILSARELSRPDGRPLYRYRLTDQEYRRIKEMLIECLEFSQPDVSSREFCALICLYVSEWFKREFVGGMWSWDPPLNAIGLTQAEIEVRKLTPRGLDFWGQKVMRRGDGDRMFLNTLIVQGGLPMALAAKQSGWLSSFVALVIRDLENGSDRSSTAALRHAEFHSFRVPEAFRKLPLLQLVAELAARIVELRHAVPAESGLDTVACLDVTMPGWRDSLPVVLEDETARRLIEGLIRTKAEPPATPILAERCIVKAGDSTLSFGLRLRLDGFLDVSRLPNASEALLEGFSRARLMPSGPLAERVQGCLAILDRPTKGEACWAARSILQGNPVIRKFSLRDQVSASLHVDGRDLCEIEIPGGGAIDSEVLTFRAGSTGELNDIRLLGTGSVRSRDEAVLVAMTSSVEKVTVQSGTLTDVGLVDGLTLHRLQGQVRIETSDGLIYQITSSSDRDDIGQVCLTGDKVSDLSASVPVFAGVPKIQRLAAGGLLSAIPDHLVRWRPVGSKAEWRALNRQSPPVGLIEITSFEDGIVRDRTRLGIVPAGATVRRETVGQAASVSLYGFRLEEVVPTSPGTTLSIMNDPAADTVRLTYDAGERLREIPVELRWPGSASLRAKLPLVGNEIVFFNASGERVAHRTVLSVADLRGMTIETGGRAVLRGELIQGGRVDEYLSLNRSFERSLALAHVRNELLGLFACADDLDCEVRLYASSGANEARIDVQRYDLRLINDGGRVGFDRRSAANIKASGAIEIVGRPFVTLLGQEHVLRVCSLEELPDARLDIPQGRGPWLVFAKVDGVSRSRPLFMPGVLEDGVLPTLDPIVQAMLTEPEKERESNILAQLKAAEEASGTEALSYLKGMIKTFKGYLPLQTFDVLRLLHRCPGAGVALLAAAETNDLPLLIEIEGELPFWWTLTPMESWCEVFRRRLEVWEESLSFIPDPTDRKKLATGRLVNQLQSIEDVAPSLKTHLDFVRLSLKLDPSTDGTKLLQMPYQAAIMLTEQHGEFLADECIRRNGERSAWPNRPNFRARVSLLPKGFMRFDEGTLTVLDAPHVAAQISLGILEITSSIDRGLRACRSFDQAYFDEAFPVALTRLWAYARGDALIPRKVT
ncbi:STY4851/ECs_5259 family protein [Microvirga arsenatis]|uniref:STY4851/ECs_5259 family protein n=1 Tax=Microvirga arsenatis TaxID=2692265 RepID=UPI001AEDB4D0|nr:STY4851/ECs_5259 family protein [Microvirga arsenatis]